MGDLVALNEATRLLQRIAAATTIEVNGHRTWRQVAKGKAQEWSEAMDDAVTFLEAHQRGLCPPQAHRYVDINESPNPPRLVCRRCGLERVEARSFLQEVGPAARSGDKDD